ncbi:hypothetical protein J5991_10135, partial [Methanocorpusculum sp.]|nr:hypothetical protein [Methanocorpusculum sp.]
IYICSYGDSFDNVKVDIDDGIFDGDLSLTHPSQNSATGVETLEISGGTFNGKSGFFTEGDVSKLNEKSEIIGGTFKVDVSDYVEEGYVCVVNDDKTFSVVKTPENAVVPETPKVDTAVTTDAETGEVTSTTISKGEYTGETSIKKTGDGEVTIASSASSTETNVIIVITGIDNLGGEDNGELDSVTIPASAEITANYGEIPATNSEEGTKVELSLKIEDVTGSLPVIDASLDTEIKTEIEGSEEHVVLAMITAINADKNENINTSDEKAIQITFKIPKTLNINPNKLGYFHVQNGVPGTFTPIPLNQIDDSDDAFYLITIYGKSFSSYVLAEAQEVKNDNVGSGSAVDTGSGNYQYYPRDVPTNGIISFGTSKVVTGMELPAGSDGTVTLNTKPTFAMPENGFYAFEIDAPGYNTDAKINGGLSFQIPVADLEAAGWTAEDIVLFHGTVGEDGKITWEALPTNLVKNENGVAYYKAAINSCSPFYIGFVKDGSVVNTEVVDPTVPETPEQPVTPDEPEVLPPVEVPTEEPETPASPAPILAVLAGLGAVVALRRK